MFLTIHTAPPSEMRYVTVGDWEYNFLDPYIANELRIKVTVVSTGNNKYNFLLGVHELVEAFVYGIQEGFTEEAQHRVDDFDINWTSDNMYDEPGDDPTAPYHFAHRFATVVEHMLAFVLGVDWNAYDDKLGEMILQMTNARKQNTTDSTLPGD
jgi:hypothetical protein